MNNSNKKFNILLLTALAFCSGFLMIAAMKAYTVSYESEIAPKFMEIINYIEELETETTELESSIIKMRSDVENLRAQLPQDTQISAQMQQDIDILNMKAGLKEITGSGINITLDDNTAGAELAQKTNPASYNPEKYIIHYHNLLYIIRELAPATEAISINDIRLTDNYNIRCVGTVIMLNSTRIAPPYKISVIGDQNRLEKLLNECPEYNYLKNNNIPVRYSLENKLVLPASVMTIDIKNLESIDN